MPDGKTHFRGNALVTGLLPLAGVAAGYVISGNLDRGLELAIGLLVGATVGLMCTPDWDIKHTTETERIFESWPKVIGFPLRLASDGYGILCKQHRGLSHKWLRGTLTRILYLGAAYLVFTWMLFGALWSFGGDPTQLREILWSSFLAIPGAGFFLAWYIQDWDHLFLDRIPLTPQWL